MCDKAVLAYEQEGLERSPALKNETAAVVQILSEKGSNS